jgi:hypothetical protein
MTPQELLAAVADHFEAHPEAWTQGAFARDAAGDDLIRPVDRDAVCWCVSGALYKFAMGSEETRRAAWGRLHTAVGTMVTVFNDAPDRTVADVVAKLREAAR